MHWNHVKAHSQHPLNDLVDSLAKFAATNPWRVGDCSAWQHWMHNKDTMNALQWIWYLEHLQTQPFDAPHLDGLFLHHSLRAPTLACNDEQREVSSESHTWTTTEYNITFATANVLTSADKGKPGAIYATKQQILQQQFHEAGCHIIGLQETRHKRAPGSNEWYHVVGHVANTQGVDGVQIWISKTKPLTADGVPILLKDIIIVDSVNLHRH